MRGTRGLVDGLGGDSVVAAVLVQSERRSRPPELPLDVTLTTDPDEFFAADWDVLVEAASSVARRFNAAASD